MMLRCLLILAVAALVLALGASESFAQGAWKMDLPEQNWRGPGFYLHWGKILAAWLVFLVWVHSTDWVSRDCQELKLDFIRWNPIVFGTFFGAFVLDCLNGTENSMTQAHAFKAAELCLEAQRVAVHLT